MGLAGWDGRCAESGQVKEAVEGIARLRAC